MTIKIGINGYGRIGRNVLRALYESNRGSEISIVAVNDLGDAKTNAHLTRRDTAHGRFPGTVSVEGDYMVVNGDRIRVLAERDPARLPWGDLGAEIVIEATGLFASHSSPASMAARPKNTLIVEPGAYIPFSGRLMSGLSGSSSNAR
jgi:glyceraldehyde 3-phosphate dehydrogenase